MEVYRREVIILITVSVIAVVADIDSKYDRPCMKYPQLSVANINTGCGELLSRAMAVNRPQLYFTEAESTALYTLLMLDPDAPWRELAGPDEYWIHWIVTNIPGADVQAGNIDNGTTVMAFEEPDPPYDTHRYQLYLFKQFGNLSLEGIFARYGFSLNSFILAYGLQDPVAAFEFEVAA